MGKRVEYLLAIESSCDETAAAVIDRERLVRSSVVSSQDALHRRFGGVVPEIASRAHVERILPVIDEALRTAGVSLEQLAAIAVATEPGLVGSLLVGLTAAKSLALVLDIPLLTVNHVHAHLYACRMEADRDVLPAIGLVVSGGHTNLYDCRSATGYELIGATIDDAAGEAFDKVASVLGLAYPGGPAIEQAARGGDAAAHAFPRPMLHEPHFDFSFSGLKTAVLYTVQGRPGGPPAPPLTDARRADIAASFQAAAVDVLVEKTRRAARSRGRSTLLVGGGVAANGVLRARLSEMATGEEFTVHFAPRALCTDNAAMGAIAWEAYEAGQFADLDVDVIPGLIRRRASPGTSVCPD